VFFSLLVVLDCVAGGPDKYRAVVLDIRYRGKYISRIFQSGCHCFSLASLLRLDKILRWAYKTDRILLR